MALDGERPVASLLLRTSVVASDRNDTGDGYSCFGGAVCLKNSLVGNGDNLSPSIGDDTSFSWGAWVEMLFGVEGRFKRPTGVRILGGDDCVKLVLTGSGHSWSSCISGSCAAGEFGRGGALDLLRACSLVFEGPRNAGPEVEMADEALFVSGCAVLSAPPVGKAVVTCSLTPFNAGAGDEVADLGCFRLDLRGMYDEGDGNNCKGVEVEGVFAEDMVPDQCKTRRKAKRQTGSERKLMHAERLGRPRGHREAECTLYMFVVSSGYLANERARALARHSAESGESDLHAIDNQQCGEKHFSRRTSVTRHIPCRRTAHRHIHCRSE